MKKQTKETFMYVLAAMLVLSILAIVLVLIFVEIPNLNKDMLYMVIGALISAFTAVVSYFFGSSKGSADKTELMSKEIQKP